MSGEEVCQRKLVVLVAAAIGIATFVSTGIGLWQQTAELHRFTSAQALVTTAQVFAAAAAQATATRERRGRIRSLRGMGRVRDIRYAEIRTPTAAAWRVRSGRAAGR